MVAPYQISDMVIRYPIGSMYLHPAIAERGDRVGQAHQNDDGTGGGHHFKVVPGNVHVHDILPDRLGQEFQETIRFDRAHVHGFSLLPASRCIVTVRISITLPCVR